MQNSHFMPVFLELLSRCILNIWVLGQPVISGLWLTARQNPSYSVCICHRVAAQSLEHRGSQEKSAEFRSYLISQLRKSKVLHFVLNQGSSTLTQLTFGAGSFFVTGADLSITGCCSIPGLYALDVNAPLLPPLIISTKNVSKRPLGGGVD